jgi:hypothetical protein
VTNRRSCNSWHPPTPNRVEGSPVPISALRFYALSSSEPVLGPLDLIASPACSPSLAPSLPKIIHQSTQLSRDLLRHHVLGTHPPSHHTNREQQIHLRPHCEQPPASCLATSLGLAFHRHPPPTHQHHRDTLKRRTDIVVASLATPPRHHLLHRDGLRRPPDRQVQRLL